MVNIFMTGKAGVVLCFSDCETIIVIIFSRVRGSREDWEPRQARS